MCNGTAKVTDPSDTGEPVQYDSKIYPDLRFWNMPGLGSFGRNRHKYMGYIENIGAFDLFLVCSACRFINQDELWLVKTVKSSTDSIIFVRTKIDADIEESHGSKGLSIVKEPTSPSDMTVQRNVHSYYRKKFFAHSLVDVPVFVVSNMDRDLGDFPELTRHLSKCSMRKSQMRRKNLTKACLNALKLKKQNIFRTKWILASACGLLAGSTDAPWLPMAGDVLFLVYCKYLYSKEYALDKTTDEHECTYVSATSPFPHPLLRAPCTTAWLICNTIRHCSPQSALWIHPVDVLVRGFVYTVVDSIVSVKLSQYDTEAKQITNNIIYKMLPQTISRVSSVSSLSSLSEFR
jgi:hypothetical protein